MSANHPDSTIGLNGELTQQDAEPKTGWQRFLRKARSMVHQNHLTASRVPGTIIAMIADQMNQYASAGVYFTWNVGTDALDGPMAREHGEATREGAVLDPLCDKICNAFALSYQAWSHQSANPGLATAALSVAVATSIGTNAYSQWKRAPIEEQLADAYRAVRDPASCQPEKEDSDPGLKAVWPGKWKQGIECVTITTMFAAGEHTEMRIMAAAALFASSILAVMGTHIRERKRKNRNMSRE